MERVRRGDIDDLHLWVFHHLLVAPIRLGLLGTLQVLDKVLGAREGGRRGDGADDVLDVGYIAL